MAKVLVIRLSSFGDVAMLVPVVYSIAAKYPLDKFTVLTRTAFMPLFQNLGFNINAMPFDPVRHKSIIGLFRLTRRVAKFGFTYIADEHDVLRTKVIRRLLKPRISKTVCIDKGRGEKEAFIENKQTDTPIKSSIDRYLDVFDKLGYPAELTFTNFFEFTQKDFYLLRSVVKTEEKTGKWIGIAPFSKHEQKIYPLDKMENVLETLTKDPNNHVFLFGASKAEEEVLSEWSKKYPNTISTAGQFGIVTELLLISYLDVMISMDSANMHLASLVETPVVSIWGATHPHMGFYGYRQDPENAVHLEMPCRPCSVYGNIPCDNQDKFACLTNIPESAILEKVEKVLSNIKS